jgi:hypothetical protein
MAGEGLFQTKDSEASMPPGEQDAWVHTRAGALRRAPGQVSRSYRGQHGHLPREAPIQGPYSSTAADPVITGHSIQPTSWLGSFITIKFIVVPI